MHRNARKTWYRPARNRRKYTHDQDQDGTDNRKWNHFNSFTVAYVTRIGDHKAETVRNLVAGIERCSDESIYHHMVEALESEEDLAGRASNDFVKWAYGPVNCGGLAELLASLDERYCTSIEENATICGRR